MTLGDQPNGGISLVAEDERKARLFLNYNKNLRFPAERLKRRRVFGTSES
jgi:hypothetical protein